MAHITPLSRLRVSPSGFKSARVPKLADGALAVARLANVGDAATLRRTARAAGFEEVGQNFFRHPQDQSWIAQFENGNIERGVGNSRFSELPDSVLDLNLAGKFTVLGTAKLASLVDRLEKGPFKSHVKTLTAAGFTAKNPVFYEHADGSWVASIGNRTVMGVRDMRVDAESFVFLSETKGKPKPLKTVPETWNWFKRNTALGKTPRLGTDESARAVLHRKGYHLTEVKRGVERWRHDDGSWVDLKIDDSIRLGFQNRPLGKLPFNNRKSP